MLDFVGIFDKLDKALAFDSDEINPIVKDVAPPYLALIDPNFDDKDVENSIKYFRDPDRRKVFFWELKEEGRPRDSPSRQGRPP